MSNVSLPPSLVCPHKVAPPQRHRRPTRPNDRRMLRRTSHHPSAWFPSSCTATVLTDCAKWNRSKWRSKVNQLHFEPASSENDATWQTLLCPDYAERIGMWKRHLWLFLSFPQRWTCRNIGFIKALLKTEALCMMTADYPPPPPSPLHHHPPTHPQKYILILHPTPPRSPPSPSFSLALFPWHRSSLLTSKLSFLKSQGRKEKKKAELGP